MFPSIHQRIYFTQLIATYGKCTSKKEEIRDKIFSIKLIEININE